MEFNCPACGHALDCPTSYCEECGANIFIELARRAPAGKSCHKCPLCGGRLEIQKPSLGLCPGIKIRCSNGCRVIEQVEEPVGRDATHLSTADPLGQREDSRYWVAILEFAEKTGDKDIHVVMQETRELGAAIEETKKGLRIVPGSMDRRLWEEVRYSFLLPRAGKIKKILEIVGRQKVREKTA